MLLFAALLLLMVAVDGGCGGGAAYCTVQGILGKGRMIACSCDHFQLTRPAASPRALLSVQSIC